MDDLPSRNLVVSEVGYTVETVSRVKPIVVWLETSDPSIPNLDCIVPWLILLIFRKRFKTKHRMMGLEVLLF